MSKPPNSESHPSTTLLHAAKAQGGDQDAWQALDRRVRPWLIETLRRRDFPAASSPEDLIQEVMLEVRDTFDRFVLGGESSFRKWVLTIAHMRLADLRRRARTDKRGGARRLHSLDAEGPAGLGLDPADDAAPSHTRHVRGREFADAFASTLAAMQPKQRMILELRLVDELPYADVVEKMSFRTEEAARSFFMRTREVLQEKLRRFA